MNSNQLHLLLADDDYDDCVLFREALEGLDFCTLLTEFHYGDQLMNWLNDHSGDLPDALFFGPQHAAEKRVSMFDGNKTERQVEITSHIYCVDIL